MSGYVWGVDVARARTAIVALDYTSNRVVNEIVTHKALSYRAVSWRIEEFARAWFGDFPPLTIAVEMPMGLHPEPELMLTVGAVHIGLHNGTDLCPWSLNISAWKKHAVGWGNASKEQVRDWSLGAGADESWTQDEHDAHGVAWGAREIWRRGQEQAA